VICGMNVEAYLDSQAEDISTYLEEKYDATGKFLIDENNNILNFWSNQYDEIKNNLFFTE